MLVSYLQIFQLILSILASNYVFLVEPEFVIIEYSGNLLDIFVPKFINILEVLKSILTI